eukprot:jgi/Orpsp1_1/1176236/evm.model.c7180000056912.1
MLPPHLRSNGIKNTKYSSPLKNQVEVKEEKSSYSSLYDVYSDNENIIPSNNIISRSKSTSEALEQQKKYGSYTESYINSDLRKSNSLNNTNYNYKKIQINYLNLDNNKEDVNENLLNNNNSNNTSDNTSLNVNKSMNRTSFIEQNVNNNIKIIFLHILIQHHLHFHHHYQIKSHQKPIKGEVLLYQLLL